MLTKFESKSNRVKGLSFHPVRPWILASLHNGVIQLWDYRMGTLLDRFEEHDGPVRGVDFHKTQPLIVSGGDDYKVKVWDYKLRRCLFTLLGHLDYIRTVQFHNEYPWIVSASDDQVIRIWNWQSRACISVLTGHNHYVMCAGFHPKEDLIISASLDQTIRVWDTAGLRKKTVRGLPSMDDGSVANRINNDLFGGNDAVVKYVLEGHDRGVNWASFHPTLPLIVSGADDRQVKLWRMNETKAWEVDTMRGHTNNVSCVIFHPKHELILSNSEDRTIRVWDISKRLSVQTFRRESDRFWILATHPEQNLLAAGHDSGMLVFKLERERPPYDVHGSRMFYVKDRYLRLHEFGSARDVPIHSLRRTGTATTGLGGGPRQLQYNSYNPGEHNLLITSDADGGSYELITFACEGGPGSGPSGEPTDSRRGSAISVAFIARNRFATLDKSRQLVVKNMENEVVKKITPPVPTVDQIFFGGVSGRLLLRSEDKIILYDQAARKVLAELQVPRVKYVVWSPDCSYVALLAKHQVVLATKHLEQLSSSAETVRVKSGSWCMHKPVFVYSTLNHVKYLLSNGDKGIVRALEAPVYITKATDQQLGCLDREGKTRTLSIDLTEALFKLALEEKNYPEVMRMVKHSRLCGEAIVSFLQEKGYPEVALHFVQDKHTRFRLALACGNIEIAMNVAYEIGDDKCWRQLAAEALRQGNHEVVEMAYQKTKQFERLSFLYLLTGNMDKLRKMLKIAEMRNDVMSRFHNALFLGDAEERARVLEYTGQYSLAYLTAAVHGLEEMAEGLKEKLVAGGLDIPEVPANPSLLQPPTPIMRADNWPLLSVGKSVLAGIAAGEYEAPVSKVEEDVFHDARGHDAWGGDDLDLDDDVAAATESKIEGGGWDLDDLDLGDDDFETIDKSEARGGRGGGERMADGSIFVTPNPGTPATSYWIDNSSHAADHAAAGSMETAMTLLNRQIAAAQFAPLKSNMFATYMGAYAFIPGLPSTPSRRIPLQRNAATGNPGKDSLPMTTVKLQPLLEDLKNAYRTFTQGAFGESQALFTRIIQTIPLVLTESRSEGNELKELLEVSREYITAIRLKSAMAETNDPVRTMELSAYFTHCNLQPAHLVLALKLAMSSAFKFKNYITTASFARRLLELPDVNSEKNADLRTKTAKVLQRSEKEGRNEHQLQYDERNPFVIDCFYLAPIYRGTESARCPYCSSAYSTDVRGRICDTCGIAQIGVETVGLVTTAAATTRN